MKKEIKKGKWVLTHERYLDDMGFEEDAFDLFDNEKRIHRPFFGKFKIHDKGLNFPINRIPFDYTTSDYEEMLDEQVSKFDKKD